MDSIQLSGIRCYGYTGVLPEEQVLGQWFEVELTLWLDLAAAGQSDRLDETLDYRTVIAAVQTLVKTGKVRPFRALGNGDRRGCSWHPSSSQGLLVQQVRVRLCKPAAPIPDFGGTITIEVTRSR